jgi:hypothetical protein
VAFTLVGVRAGQQLSPQQKTGKEGLEAALSILRAQLGPLVTGAEGTRYTEVLRRAKALARAIEDLEGQTARGKDPRAGRGRGSSAGMHHTPKTGSPASSRTDWRPSGRSPAI